jgi:hypothetical protein
MLTLVNTFHDTTARLRAVPGDTLSAAQERRLRKTLCGMQGCTCSGAGGVRGGDYVVTIRTYWPAAPDGRPYVVEPRA